MTIKRFESYTATIIVKVMMFSRDSERYIVALAFGTATTERRLNSFRNSSHARSTKRDYAL